MVLVSCSYESEFVSLVIMLIEGTGVCSVNLTYAGKIVISKSKGAIDQIPASSSSLTMAESARGRTQRCA